MDLMEIRRMLMQPHTLTIGGLPVLINNYKYAAGSQAYDQNIVYDKNFFITGWYDTGSTASKSYTLGPSRTNDYWYGRWYNDKSDAAVDYWGTNKSTQRTVSTPGRYVVFSVDKSQAENFWVKTNNIYIIKGKNVT